jgi:hypothetical protein
MDLAQLTGSRAQNIETLRLEAKVSLTPNGACVFLIAASEDLVQEHALLAHSRNWKLTKRFFDLSKAALMNSGSRAALLPR